MIGWVGQLLLAICAIPQTFKTIRTKKAEDISFLFLTFWYVGEILSFIYIIPLAKLPLILNYGLNITCLTIIFYYKARYNKTPYQAENTEKHKIKVIWSKQDNIYLAYPPESFPYLENFAIAHGNTIEEAVKEYILALKGIYCILTLKGEWEIDVEEFNRMCNNIEVEVIKSKDYIGIEEQRKIKLEIYKKNIRKTYINEILTKSRKLLSKSS
jgi:uncharacterized protein with PQ loop repeat